MVSQYAATAFIAAAALAVIFYGMMAASDPDDWPEWAFWTILLGFLVSAAVAFVMGCATLIALVWGA